MHIIDIYTHKGLHIDYQHVLFIIINHNYIYTYRQKLKDGYLNLLLEMKYILLLKYTVNHLSVKTKQVCNYNNIMITKLLLYIHY